MTTDEKDSPEKGDRIAKVLARAGLCSRRDAERWITEGRVKLDGVVLTSPAVTVTKNSIVLVDGKPLAEPEPTRLWRYHKPDGLVTSHKDEKGRETMFERLPAELGRVISIGRLDLTSEGLILLTNDGELARKLELPSTGWVRRYKVRFFGHLDSARMKSLDRGVVIDGVHYGPIKAEFERQQGSNAWATVALTEGKNREIRRVFEYLGVTVTRLIRLSYGPFQLGSLERGAVEEIPRRVLRDQLGLGAASDKGKQTVKLLDADKPITKAAGEPTTGRAASTRTPRPKPSATAPNSMKIKPVKPAAANTTAPKPASARPMLRKDADRRR